MEHFKQFIMRDPGGDNEGSSAGEYDNDKKTGNEESSNLKEGTREKKSFSEKIHDALQEWSNDDQQDQEFDDTRP